jgi:energy-coupling factor transporter transmembrane protein EcfT
MIRVGAMSWPKMLVWIFVVMTFLNWMIQGKHFFLFKKRPGRHMSRREHLKRRVDTIIRCTWMLIMPVPTILGVWIFWYYKVHLSGYHLCDIGNSSGATILISSCTFIYGLLANNAIGIVWGQHIRMRDAVKNNQIDVFMNLKDEELPPLVHLLLMVLSSLIVFGVMTLNYRDLLSGTICVSAITYLFALIFYVIVDIDDPMTGVWVIRDIPKLWFEIDAKKWRQRQVRDQLKRTEDEFATLKEREPSLFIPHQETYWWSIRRNKRQ